MDAEISSVFKFDTMCEELANIISGGWSKQDFQKTEQVCGDRWSHQLQQDIIDLILDRLGVLDHLRFAAVCTSWRAAVARSMATSVLEFPLLLYGGYPPLNDDHLLSSLVGDKYYSLNPLYTKGSQIVGVIEGRWLIMVKHSCWHPSFDAQRHMEKTTHHFLLNPVTGKQFILPPQSTISGTNDADPYFFAKIVASTVPTTSNCLVAGLSSSGLSLAFCRLTDTKWTLLNQDDEVQDLKFTTIIFCDGKLYASTSSIKECVIVFDLSRENKNGVYKAQKIVMASPSPILHRPREVRKEELVYSFYKTFYSLAADTVSRELLLILVDTKLSSKEHPELHNYDAYKLDVVKFEVLSLSLYKIDIADDHNQWMKVTDLGDRLMFIGNYGSFFIPTKAFGEPTQGNCIYYAFKLNIYCEVGKFCLDKQIIIQGTPKPMPINGRHANGWFVPTLI